MKKKLIALLGAGFCFSHNVESMTWKSECVSYYKMHLPNNLDVALYPIKGFVNPEYRPEGNGYFITRRYAGNGITFGDKFNRASINTTQAQFSSFYYSGFKLGISNTNTHAIDFPEYRMRRIDSVEFNKKVSLQEEELDFKVLGKTTTDKAEFDRQHKHILKDYPSAFADYDYRGYILYISRDNRLNHFWGKNQKDSGDKSQTAESQVQKSEPQVLSLLNRFRSRKLYEIPSEQGFCLPYGFIAGDSGYEQRNMGVTWRLKEHPDVTIFFQDLGPDPGPGESRPDPNMSAKDYVTDFWNVRYGHSFRDIKLYGKGFSYPEIDKRKAVAAFAKFTRFSKEVDYGYVAFVKGTTPDEPDLLFYVMRDSRQAKARQPMDKDELEKMAEHIVSSIKKR